VAVCYHIFREQRRARGEYLRGGALKPTRSDAPAAAGGGSSSAASRELSEEHKATLGLPPGMVAPPGRVLQTTAVL
jgi:hypothetical protein